MDKDVVILVADDEKGHYVLTKRRLRRGGLSNEMPATKTKTTSSCLTFACRRSMEWRFCGE